MTSDSPAPPPPGESRKHKRFSVDVDATVRTENGTQVSARTRDVSQTGICLIGDQSVSAGENLIVDLVLAFANDSYSEPLRLSARVVWCTPIGGHFQIGAMFDEVSEEKDTFLEMLLQFLDGTLAPRGVNLGESEDKDETAVAHDDPNEKDNPFA